jgi:ribulose-phosphate 3-epimerase
MVEIIPSILTDSAEDFRVMMKKIEPHASRVHLDIADGRFVPNKTICGFAELDGLATGLKVGVHLMVSNPEEQIENWLHLVNIETIIVHIESTNKMSELLDMIKRGDKIVGIALNPSTSFEDLEPFLHLVDLVHFMTVVPGYYGSKFQEPVLEKIAQFHSEYPNIHIRVDGGITPDTASRVVRAGASSFISGSYIMNSSNVGEAISALRSATIDL